MTFFRSTSTSSATSTSTSTRRHRIAVFGIFVIAIIGVLGGNRSRASATTPPPPPNDNLGSATVLSGSAGRVFQLADSATTQLREPVAAGTHTIWFKWTAPSTGTTSFNLLGWCSNKWHDNGWAGSLHAFSGTN